MRILVLIVTLLIATPLGAAELRLATWNIAWLTLRPADDPLLPEGLTRRRPEDYRLLAAYARRLEADVVALQEVDGPEAAARVFDPREWVFFFADDNAVQRTGFAVRRGLRAWQNPDLAELDTRPHARLSLRRGTDITVEAEGVRLRLLSIHLKAGCRDGRLSRPTPDCETLAEQTEILAGWVAARRREGIPFAIMGDFNRRMRGPRDDMLDRLTAEAPLLRTSEGASDPCWAGARGTRPFIDHILLGGGAERWWVRSSLRVLVYAERDRSYRDRLSDHCPISIRLRLPASRAG
ncbi:endonuclease/exonuclease/phosphatase family protein [Crenalkalicoccus roseus]|uniref:endonuclease/exonuclease/phosphatase family protein n=1 Tax=Crenalkalicoccus roseus TaxID=1485588 RepID=UPI001081E3EA|nr:endonuclease/exonuclease/phosphatase family protein [Crenalkalicoccus roseus]